MKGLVESYGMDVDEGCRAMMSQIAEGKFWVSSQPEMTVGSVAARIEFLKGQKEPELAIPTRRIQTIHFSNGFVSMLLGG
ncbi:hypothetical protein IMZ48_29930 [Candidatus Bathyarchaeota archaeon]|nr:hypothetical protein [Candidatus Bathyarchaeota archaeon]